MGGRTKQFPKEQMVKKYMKKLFNIFSHEGNANRNDIEMYLIPVRTAIT
jgi:hypothetical protein